MEIPFLTNSEIFFAQKIRKTLTLLFTLKQTKNQVVKFVAKVIFLKGLFLQPIIHAFNVHQGKTVISSITGRYLHLSSFTCTFMSLVCYSYGTQIASRMSLVCHSYVT